MSLARCQSNEGSSTVTFGSEEQSPLCGKIQDVTQENTVQLNSDSSLTELFKKMGDKGGMNWNSNGVSSGQVKCLSGIKGGILDQPSGGEHLGYCDNSEPKKESKDTSFLEIKKDDSNVQEIRVCSNNCGANVGSQDSQTIQQLSTASESQGKKLEFYKK